MNIQGKDRYMQNTWYIWLVVLAWIFLLYLLRKRRQKSAAIRHVKYRKKFRAKKKGYCNHERIVKSIYGKRCIY